jgi:succinyl-CoA synthetase beta subunit
VRRIAIDIRHGILQQQLEELTHDSGLDDIVRERVTQALERLYAVYRDIDAELVEVNPLVVTHDGAVLALDAKISLDSGAVARHPGLVDEEVTASMPAVSDRVRAARDLGLSLIELDGNVGVLANGAGLTMTTLDAVAHYGGRAANFLEIGGDAYTKATRALEIVLSDPAIRSVVVNFCGAFARTDVMAEGVVKAIHELRPTVPFFFSIHGTGEHEAVRMVRDGLGVEPFDRMDDAVKAAVQAADRAEEVA